MDKRKQRAAKEKRRQEARLKKRGEAVGGAPRLGADEVEAALTRSYDALQAGDGALAERVARKALRGAPDQPRLLANLAAALEQQGRPAEALVVATRVVEGHPELAEAHVNQGVLRRFLGDLDGARASFRAAVERAPDHPGAWRNLATVKRFTDPDDPDLAAMEALLARQPLRSPGRVALHFALAKALDELERTGDAFEHLERGNRLERARVSYSREAFSALVDATIAAHDAAFVGGPVAPGASDAAPILVVGMPRSGSTLIEQILASHPEVAGVGEVRDLKAILAERYADVMTRPAQLAAATHAELAALGRAYAGRLAARAPDRPRVVDKALDNYLDVGLLARALPGARIVHAVREPVANAFACYRVLFTSPLPFAYDLEDIAHHHDEIARLMAHWDEVLPGRVLRVSYEALVADQEGESRRLLEHCGLAWDPAVLRFHETERPVNSASATQVRAPLHGEAVERWRRYEEHLGPLVAAYRVRAISVGHPTRPPPARGAGGGRVG